MKSQSPLLLALLFLGCHAEPEHEGTSNTSRSTPVMTDTNPNAALSGDEALPADFEVATLAGGCFWCIEAPFEKTPGILSAVSGYTGGHTADPTYQEIGTGRTGHTEAVQITFDPAVLSYADLLEIFWRQFDPTDAGGSFADRGSQYRTAIFTHSEEQRRIAEASRGALGDSGRFHLAIVTEIAPLDVYYPAEDYHQNYYKKNPAH